MPPDYAARSAVGVLGRVKSVHTLHASRNPVRFVASLSPCDSFDLLETSHRLARDIPEAHSVRIVVLDKELMIRQDHKTASFAIFLYLALS
mmetsp:Transcript_16802/g.27234  ORF Transcript_16802/g.27234 Transcript_16802/m.27234 type:complete len:91 (+) Transcript_16802:1738-2010(+)